MEVKLNERDIEICVEFALKYFLDSNKTNSNRTTGQSRGLGSIINDFLIGKLLEIGVKKAIEVYNDNKKIILDFDIHPLNANNRNDPDIIGVQNSKNKKIRPPALHLEIKNSSVSDRYLGLTKEQFTAIQNRAQINNNLSKIYIIYASLVGSSKSLNADPLGAYLRNKIPTNKLYNKFVKSNELYVQIKYIINGIELKNYGTEFKNNSFFYETYIIGNELNARQIDNVKKIKGARKIINNKFPITMENKVRQPKEFGNFYLTGTVKKYIKKNNKTKKVFVEAISDAKIKNEFLGEFKLKKGNFYPVHFTTMSRDPKLKRNNIWISITNIKNITKKTVSQRLIEIAKNI